MFPFDLLRINNDFRVVGENCVLIPMSKRDLALVKKWFKDRDLVSYAFGTTAEDNVLDKIAHEYTRDFFSNSDEIMGIWHNDIDLIGFVNYSGNGSPSGIVRIGVVIGSEDYRSRGIGTEAMNLALYYLFDYKGIKRIDLDTVSFNERALKCFQKCGFKKTGEMTQVNFLDGELIHKIEMSLDKKEFYTTIERFGKMPHIEFSKENGSRR
ncbi:MAG: GNAT family N-acetyltransferase [Candidatus Eremiobacteraeota bacterium]|nr:GNAT family N-acetyltransferase [Candidatus Eremiobacteraeota bacterium]